MKGSHKTLAQEGRDWVLNSEYDAISTSYRAMVSWHLSFPNGSRAPRPTGSSGKPCETGTHELRRALSRNE